MKLEIPMPEEVDALVDNVFRRVTTELGITGWRWEWSSAGGYCWLDQHLIQLLPDGDVGGYAQQLIHEIAHIQVVTSVPHCPEFWDKVEELTIRYLGEGLNEWQIDAAKIYAPTWKSGRGRAV